MDNGINRVGDGWDIHSMRGIGIGEVIIGNVLRLHTGSSRIEVHSPAELTTDHEAVPVHASTRTNLDRLPQLLDQVVAEVHAADSGSLRVRFANSWRLDVPVSSDASGWVIGLRGSSSISSLPGGGVRMPTDHRLESRSCTSSKHRKGPCIPNQKVRTPLNLAR